MKSKSNLTTWWMLCLIITKYKHRSFVNKSVNYFMRQNSTTMKQLIIIFRVEEKKRRKNALTSIIEAIYMNMWLIYSIQMRFFVSELINFRVDLTNRTKRTPRTFCRTNIRPNADRCQFKFLSCEWKFECILDSMNKTGQTWPSTEH